MEPHRGNTKKVLLVDDDALVLRMYRLGLERHGFEVIAAGDGLAALKTLRANKPDLVVLDLMMPKFTGVDVVKFIRSEADLAGLPVVVLSNSYMDDLAQQAARVGVQKALLKVRCTPSVLTGIINDVLAGKAGPAGQDPAAPALVPGAHAGLPSEAETDAADFSTRARRDFLDHAPATCAVIRKLCQEFTHARSEVERERRLQDFYRKIHFVSATAGLAQCHPIALLASVFEALLFGLIDKPAAISPSVLRTVVFTVDFFGTLFDHARETTADVPLSAQVLAVDDDPLSNRLVVAALQRFQLEARSTENPLTALRWLRENRFDLVLLDVEMPDMNGFDLCKQLRTIPGYGKTPVIYVTGHSDFDSRAKSVLSGGNDLIAKPVFPIELAAKAVTHLLQSRLAEPTPAG